MFDLVIEDLVKSYSQADPPVVKEVSLSVQKGELISLLGPSGCGKTTILRLIAGLLQPDDGQVYIRDKIVTSQPSYKRDVGMVFQNYALFPHMTVKQNVGFGLRMRKIKGAKAEERIIEALEMVDLKGFGDRYPKQLSGGQQQRVALARALVIRPTVLLLDEPLSALDAKLRYETREQIRRLQQNLGVSTVFVTHDQEEALAMSDKVAVLDKGVIQQYDRPEVLYSKPSNRFVAQFMGVTNIFDASFVGQDRYVTTDGINVSASQSIQEIEAIAVRPESIRVGVDNKLDDFNTVNGEVIKRVYTGAEVNLTIKIVNEKSVIATIPIDSVAANSNIGDKVTLSWDPNETILLKQE